MSNQQSIVPIPPSPTATPAVNGMTINEAIEIYTGVASTLSSHGWKYWCRAFSSRWGDRPVASIGLADINLWIAERRKEGRSEATIKNQRNTLRQLFRTAEDAGEPVKWPDRLAKVVANNSRVRTFEGKEEESLRKVMLPEDWIIVELAKSTGLRSAELWNLRRKDVDLNSRFLNVVNGKGRKSRKVPLGKTALKLLRKIMNTQRSEYIVVPVGHEHYKHRYTSCSIWKERVWRPALRAAGIQDMHFHDMRHCFASTMARAGKSIQAIQLCMGHSSLAMTMRYSHLNNAALLDAVSCV